MNRISCCRETLLRLRESIRWVLWSFQNAIEKPGPALVVQKTSALMKMHILAIILWPILYLKVVQYNKHREWLTSRAPGSRSSHMHRYKSFWCRISRKGIIIKCEQLHWPKGQKKKKAQTIKQEKKEIVSKPILLLTFTFPSILSDNLQTETQST